MRIICLLDFLHKSKIVEGFLEETKPSNAAYTNVREERRRVSTTKSPTRLTYAGSLLFTALITLSACNKKVQEKIGIVTSGPDEYKTQRNKSLEIPPHYDLPSTDKISKETASSSDTKILNDGERALMKEIEK